MTVLLAAVFLSVVISLALIAILVFALGWQALAVFGAAFVLFVLISLARDLLFSGRASHR